MNCQGIIVAFLIFVCDFVSLNKAAKLPLYVKPCSRSSPNLNKCALENGRLAIPVIIKGDPKFHIPNMQPLKIDEVKLEGSRTLTLKLKDVEVYGLEGAQLREINIDLKKKEISAKVYLPLATIISKYEVKGQILVVPINGNGPANFTFVDTIVNYKYKFNFVQKKGENYQHITDNRLEYDTKRGYFHLENLFNGDKQLGDQMNRLLDENWRDVLKDLGPVVSETVSTIITKIFTEILDRIPDKDMFLP